jgi:HAD superfamily hydrolase (TIGR01509 family)
VTITSAKPKHYAFLPMIVMSGNFRLRLSGLQAVAAGSRTFLATTAENVADLAPNDRLGRTMTLLIFDCDGVLVDSERLACSALAELMTTLGHAMTTEEAVLAFAGCSLNDVLARAEELLSGRIPQHMGDQTAVQLLARLGRELTAVTGVKEAIAALPYRRCVASSSGPDRLSLSLEVSGLSPVFGNDVFSAAQVANGKPAPDLFLLAARCLGTDPSNCIVIEDSVLGIEAARAAGMSAIGFAGASHAGDELARRLAATGADTVIRSMAELPAAVERLVGRRQVRTWPVDQQLTDCHK